MSMEKEKFMREPLGKELTYLSRLYFGVVTNKLSSLEIERYFYTLILIKEGAGTITQKELSEKIRSDKVFTVKILDYLSGKGMIKRTVNEKDRREHFITLTPKGEKLIPVIEEAFNEATASAFKGVSKEEQDVYYKVLSTLQKNLRAQPADEMKVNFKKVKRK